MLAILDAISQPSHDLPKHSPGNLSHYITSGDIDLLCPECQYNLIGTTSDKCPTCGWDIDADELAAYYTSSSMTSTARWAIVAGNVFCIAATLLGTNAMLSAGNTLSLLDACILLSIIIATAGHLWLGVSAIAFGSRWPMKQGEVSAIITFMAGVSIALGFIGAAQGLGFAPTTLLNEEGYQVNGPLEFAMIATVCTMPAWALLVLRLVAYRPKHRLVKDSTTSKDAPTMTRSPFTIAILKPFTSSQILCQWQDTPQAYSPAAVEHITKTWEDAKCRAQDNQRQLFNGELIRLVSMKDRHDALTLTLSPTCYRDFVGTNLSRVYHELSVENKIFADALGISVVPVTADGFIVFGLRNNSVMYHAGWIHTIGGMLEEKDRESQNVDVVGCGLRELNEELLVKHKECQPLCVIGLACDTSMRQPELMLATQLSITKQDIEKRFDCGALEQEHVKLVFVPDTPDEIIPFICRSPQLTPIAQAALLMHGYHHWGQEWYEQTCLLLYDSLPERAAF